MYSGQDVYECSKQYLQRGEYAQAIALLREQVRKKPQDSAAWNLLGIALAEQGSDDEAAKCFQKALRLDSRFPSALANLGLLQWKRGERTAAVKSLYVATICCCWLASRGNHCIIPAPLGALPDGTEDDEWVGCSR